MSDPAYTGVKAPALRSRYTTSTTIGQSNGMSRPIGLLRDQAARPTLPVACSTLPVDRAVLRRDDDQWTEYLSRSSHPDLETALVTILLQLADVVAASGNIERVARLRGAAELLGDRSATQTCAPQHGPHGVAVLFPSPPTARGRSQPVTLGHARRCPLTAREHEIAELLVLGWTNRQIAEQLVISSRTVSTHVAQILSKLGLRSRAQVPAWFLAHQDSHTDRPATHPSARQVDGHRPGR
jgi:DNA-binding NarL/FixJ family response regulator